MHIPELKSILVRKVDQRTRIDFPIFFFFFLVR